MVRTAEAINWYHSNKYSADKACEHCEGVVRHEEWCITRNGVVAYAYEAVVDPSKLTWEDQLILHALGAAWSGDNCHSARSVRDCRPE
ncbi:MAG TPA: hypothetical protein VFB04_12560 [Terriglobales bacterium]|nr:hypothetical protein [Terriglobales bacterium]